MKLCSKSYSVKILPKYFYYANLFYIQIGEAAKLKPMEVELKRLEDLSEAIVQDFTLMRKREEEMRDTNGNGSFVLYV